MTRAVAALGTAVRRPALPLVIALLAFGLLAATFGAAPARAQDVTSIVGRSARAYRSAGTLRAEFAQVIADSMIGTYESRGSLIQAGEGKLAMRFSDPDGDAVVSDGEQVWVYTPSTTPGQVLRLPLPADPVYGFNVLSWLLDRPTERYQSSHLRVEAVNGRYADVVELLPLRQDFPFTRAVVWLDQGDGLPRKLEIRERTGLTRTITLSRVRTGGSADEDIFRFQVPSGVRVVDQR